MKAKPLLFCFTYAGGTANFFDIIEKELPDIKLIKLEYAGHGERHKEGFYQNFDELTNDMFREIRDRLIGRDYGLFGYSMGSISTVEILKMILDQGHPIPKHVFLAAHEPHTKPELSGYTDGELDEWVRARTIQFGDVPEKLINNKVFWRTYLPIYRADYSIIGKYEFEKLGLETSVSATVFYSENDTPLADMKLWKKYFIGDCEFHSYTGTHFFIREHYKDMAGIINAKMLESRE